MERDQVITLNPVSHPDRRVRQVGFGLTDPYVEQCWSAVVGPSTTLLLRRLPELWREHQPAQIEASELGRSLGLSPSMAKHSPLAYTLGRLVRFRFARPVGQQRDNLDVFVEVAPLMAHQLAKVPQWTRNAHDRLLDAHLDGPGSRACRRSSRPQQRPHAGSADRHRPRRARRDPAAT